MTLARSSLVSTAATPYYHCISRCVRRAFLCGVDAVTGCSFEHRRGWIVERLARLEAIFAIDVCAYAVMNNHCHTVLKLNPETARQWSTDEVLARWSRLFSGPQVVQRYMAGERLDSGEYRTVVEFAEIWRERLVDLSWFMRCLNEPIARWANAEDGCTGRFWEGRFKSQALLDEQGLLACMAYVDLNPIRAGIAESPEGSDFTSIQQRIRALSAAPAQPEQTLDQAIPRLLGFTGRIDDNNGLPFALEDYLELVDWSGRAVHPDKKGKISEAAPPILARLGLATQPLLKYLSRQERGFHRVIGAAHSIRATSRRLQRGFLKGVSAANRLFPPATA